MDQQTADKPFRVAVFNKVAEADQAVRRLLAAGFSKDQLAVICSDKHKEQFFQNLRTPDPGPENTPEAIAAGGVVGAVVGGLALVAATIATGGVGGITGAALLVGGGAFAGVFGGAMMTRGGEKEITNYYDQALELGQILVAVEVHGEGSELRLAEAERIFTEVGAQSVALVEG